MKDKKVMQKNNAKITATFESIYLKYQKDFIIYRAYRITHRHIKAENLDDVKEKIKSIKDIKSFEILSERLNELRRLGLSGIQVNHIISIRFLEFIKKNYPKAKFKDIDTSILADFFTLLAKSYTYKSINSHKKYLLFFFKYVESQSDIKFNLQIKTSNITNDLKSSPSFLSENEIRQLMTEVNRYKNIKKKLQDVLICKIILLTGLRISEVTNLKFTNITTYDNYYIIKTTGKWNKERKVSILKSQIDDIFIPFIKYRTSYKVENPYLFISKVKNSSEYPALYVANRFNNFLKVIFYKLNIQKDKKSAHMLRHSFASYLYKQTKDILLVKDSLGHENITTTQIYAHLDDDRSLEISKTIDNLCKNNIKKDEILPRKNLTSVKRIDRLKNKKEKDKYLDFFNSKYNINNIKNTYDDNIIYYNYSKYYLYTKNNDNLYNINYNINYDYNMSKNMFYDIF